MRHLNEGDTYGRPFLELVNLCGTNRLIPEVNSTQKLDNRSSIDRSQSVECTTESTYLDMCSRVYQGGSFVYKLTITDYS